MAGLSDRGVGGYFHLTGRSRCADADYDYDIHFVVYYLPLHNNDDDTIVTSNTARDFIG